MNLRNQQPYFKEHKYTRRLILIINYLALAVSCRFGFNSPPIESSLTIGIALSGALFSLVCISLAIVVHRNFPKKHDEPGDFAKLLTTGSYRFVRHPFYSVLIVLNYMISLTFVSIYAIAASTLLLPLWWFLAKTEEYSLVCQWDEEYIECRKKVPMFFPTYRREKKEKGNESGMAEPAQTRR
jgi:protein-S-isoprenylcysteine O-methyltransferase Ste14